MRIPAGIAFMLGLTLTASAQTPWSYLGKTGPFNWGRLDPAYRACSQGEQQSPIDIHGARLNKALQPIEFHYLTAPLTLENTGNLIVAHVRPGGYILVDGTKYNLEQIVFHHPSEHEIRGKLTDMEVQLVHRSSKGKMAIIAVRLTMDRGAPNAVMSTLWEHLPAKAGATENIATAVNAGGFLPADRSYWTYMGSMTTPPCTEGVRWFVMEQDISLSREQLRQFANIFRVNTRQIQDAHGRKIEAHE